MHLILHSSTRALFAMSVSTAPKVGFHSESVCMQTKPAYIPFKEYDLCTEPLSKCHICIYDTCVCIYDSVSMLLQSCNEQLVLVSDRGYPRGGWKVRGYPRRSLRGHPRGYPPGLSQHRGALALRISARRVESSRVSAQVSARASARVPTEAVSASRSSGPAGIRAEGGKFAGIRAGICAGIRAGTCRGCRSIAELWPCGYPRGGRKVCGIPRRYLRRYLRGYPRGMSLRMPLGGSADTCAGGSSLLGISANVARTLPQWPLPNLLAEKQMNFDLALNQMLFVYCQLEKQNCHRTLCAGMCTCNSLKSNIVMTCAQSNN